MSRRIEVELTSKVEDDQWTWRAAGARQPKGVLAAKLLFDGAKVGQVVRAEVENDIDGIVVLAIYPPKEKAAEPNRLEMITPPERLVPPPRQEAPEPRGRSSRGDRPSRPDRGDRPQRPDRGDRPQRTDRPDRSSRAPGAARPDRPAAAERRPPRSDRPDRPARPKPEPAPEKPKFKRLSPGHAHRNTVLEALPPEQRAIAEQVLRGGIPAVRQAIDTQNELLKADNQTEIKAGPLVALAEDLLPHLKAAEWRDRAEAAAAAGDDISLRDLRSVVSSAEARDDESRELARKLREALDGRLNNERDVWVAEIVEALKTGRVVRGLRIASRPPDPAMRFPVELGTELSDAAGAAMAADAPVDRWLAVLDAVSVSPVRRSVTPVALPAEPTDAFMNTARQAASRVPALGPLLGMDPSKPPPPPGKRLPPKPTPPPPPPPVVEAPAEAAAPDEETVEPTTVT